MPSFPQSHTGDVAATPRRVDPFEGLARLEVDVTIEGTTALAIEPESHAIAWCVQPTGTECFSDVRVLRPEDRVTISSRDGKLLFDGLLTGQFHLLDPIHIYRKLNECTPPPGGFVIYWSPKGIDPYEWLSFFNGQNKVTVHRHTTALVPAENPSAFPENFEVA